MKLFYFPIAPNPTKVRVYLAEKGLDLEAQRVNLPAGEQRAPEFLERNPMGKLPVLELDDGTQLCESLAIIEYLEELHPDPPMIGSDPRERAHTRMLERLCDLGVLISVARIVHATRSPLGAPPSPEVAARAGLELAASLAALASHVGDQPFVAGDRVTVADCTLWAALGFAEFGQVDVPQHANLVSWRERFAKRPSAQLAP